MSQVKNRILVVDDEPLILFFLQDYLEENSYRVDVAGTLSMAREKIKFECPNLVLLDMRLSDGSGLDLLREIRSHTKTKSLPVLMMSADSDLDHARHAIAEGVNKCMVKPFNLKKLKEEVQLLLS